MTSSTRRPTRSRRFRDLPLLAKLLIPSVSILLLAGVVGGLLITHGLSVRAETTLNQALLEASLRARALLQNHELYVLESATLAANVEGMTESVRLGDREATARLLESVLALKTDLNVLAAVSREGTVAAFTRASKTSPRLDRSGELWESQPLVAAVLGSERADRSSAIVSHDGNPFLVVAAPICARGNACAAVGGVIAGLRIDELAASMASPGDRTGVAIYDLERRVLALQGRSPGAVAAARPRSRTFERRTDHVSGVEMATMYVPLEIGGREQGILALSLPVDAVTAPLRTTGIQLGLILAAALGALIVFGLMVSRSALAQVRPLLKSNRALGRGELSARAPVLGNDELGELARHFNEMAERLQANHENLESLVSQRTKEIERLLRGRTEFFASISHELRTPLAVILNRVKMMVNPMYRRTTRDRHEALHTIKHSAEELLAIVNEILELARAEAGGIELQLEPISVTEIVGEMETTILGLASARDISVSFVTPEDVPPVRADRRRLREVLLNLIDNAVKYTPAGGQIEIATRHSSDVVEISVTDNGVGVPTDAGDRIFEPFYRVPGVSTQHGEHASGLGLALAKRLVEAQGGSIDYKRRPKGGSIFTLRLATGPSQTDGGAAVEPEVSATVDT